MGAAKSASGNAAAKARTRDQGLIVIEKPVMASMVCEIVSVPGSSVIIHRFGPKAQKHLAALQGEIKPPKVPRTLPRIRDEIKDCFYSTPDGLLGFPAVSIKNSMVSGLRFYNPGIPMTETKRAFYVNGVNEKYWDMIPMNVNLSDQVNRMDLVRLPNGSPDFRFRPSFTKWSMVFVVSYYPSHITSKSILSMVEWAGMASGIGDWRIQRGGQHGAFKLNTSSIRNQKALLRKKVSKKKFSYEPPKDTPFDEVRNASLGKDALKSRKAASS